MNSVLDHPANQPAHPAPNPVPQEAPAARTAACVMAALDSAVPALRAFARAMATRWNLPGVEDALALVVSELVANSIRHSGSSDVQLVLRATALTLTVEVSDTGVWQPPAPRTDTADDPACGGRGLHIVGACCASVRIHTGRRGTHVTAGLPLT